MIINITEKKEAKNKLQSGAFYAINYLSILIMEQFQHPLH